MFEILVLDIDEMEIMENMNKGGQKAMTHV
jgi:hypothetical protein